jgi:hypothetical protein
MFRRNFLVIVNSVGNSRLDPVDGWNWENRLNRGDLSAKGRLPDMKGRLPDANGCLPDVKGCLPKWSPTEIDPRLTKIPLIYYYFRDSLLSFLGRLTFLCKPVKLCSLYFLHLRTQYPQRYGFSRNQRKISATFG